MERLRSLRALLAVARHGSTVQAAEALHISQPAVTRAVLELERSLGVSLFDRAARGMVPTLMGTGLASRADTVFSHLVQGAREAIAIAPAATRQPAAPERFAHVVSSASLRALMAIATAGTEASAAAALGVRQPAVHVALHALEQLLGVRLFYRMAVGTRLTPAGEALLRRVKLTAAEMKAMEGDVAAWRGDVRGRIVVGALPLSVAIFVPQAVETLLLGHPNIEVHIVDGTYESLMAQLLSADVDVIAGALRSAGVPNEARQHPLLDDELVVVARADHPCTRRAGLTLAELLQWPWVMPLQGTPAARVIEQVFRSAGLPPPQTTLRAGSPTLTHAFVMQTGRLAITSRGEALRDDRGGRMSILPMSLPSMVRRIGLLTRAVGEPAHDLKLFIGACHAAAAASTLHSQWPSAG